MEALTGAAKGNYTMMDNLGVAMNDTTLKAYALAKGLDVTWESATQAQKAEIAMQMFLENTAQYAGNFEREATQTISGSLGMLKASITDFVARMGDANADTAQLAGNIVSSFEAVVENVTPVLQNIVKAIPPALDALVGAIGGMLPDLLSAATELFNSLLTTIIGMLPELIPAAADAVMTIAGALLDNLPLIIEAGLQVIASIALGIGEALPELIPTIIEVILQIITVLTENAPMMVEAAVAIMTGLVTGIIDAIPILVEEAPGIILQFIEAILLAALQLVVTGAQLLVQLKEGILNGFAELLTLVGGWVDQNIIQPIRDKFGEFRNVGEQVVAKIKDGIAQAWEGIKKWFSGLWNGVFGNLTVNVNIKASGGKPNGSHANGSHANGLDYVPFDGYIAELHKGESVLTAREANDWRGGENGSTGLYGATLASAGGMGGVNIGQVNFNQPLQSTTQAAKLFGRKLVGELYA
jgi:phage-related protein